MQNKRTRKRLSVENIQDGGASVLMTTKPEYETGIFILLHKV